MFSNIQNHTNKNKKQKKRQKNQNTLLTNLPDQDFSTLDSTTVHKKEMRIEKTRPIRENKTRKLSISIRPIILLPILICITRIHHA
jgi:hypothetical protein